MWHVFRLSALGLRVLVELKKLLLIVTFAVTFCFHPIPNALLCSERMHFETVM
jgi:hypothetical protein